MLTLTAPLWLLALSLIPAIRWLHRAGPHLRSVPVSSLALWRQAAARDRAVGEWRPPDPAWRRRALIAGLLAIALAGPRFQVPVAHVTVWVDDSLSMLTRERQGTRLDVGLAQVRAALAARRGMEVEVRSLGDPWRSFAALTVPVIANLAATAGRREPLPPPEALLRHDSEHWLLTDGADPSLARWPRGLLPNRIFQVGTTTRNVGVDRLSARRDLRDPGRFNVQLRVTNGGDAPESREVTLATEAGTAATLQQQLAPGASALLTADVPAATRVTATLRPADLLTADDNLTLDLASLRQRSVKADPACPKSVVDALRSHPAVRLSDVGAEVVVDCGALAAPRPVATIRFRTSRAPVALRAPMTWSTEVQESARMHLDERYWRVRGLLDPPGPTDTLLLAAGGVPLIVARSGVPRVVETSLDPDSPGAARRPETALLVRSLLDLALDAPTLDPIALSERGDAAVRVTPIVRLGSDASGSTSRAAAVRGWAWPFLLAALLALAWEIAALARQWLALRRHARAVNA